MRNSLKSCNTLRCLTLLKDSNDRKCPLIDFDTHLSVLRIIHDESISNWKYFYFNENN